MPITATDGWVGCSQDSKAPDEWYGGSSRNWSQGKRVDTQGCENDGMGTPAARSRDLCRSRVSREHQHREKRSQDIRERFLDDSGLLRRTKQKENTLYS